MKRSGMARGLVDEVYKGYASAGRVDQLIAAVCFNSCLEVRRIQHANVDNDVYSKTPAKEKQ
jgi:hypothetical protein